MSDAAKATPELSIQQKYVNVCTQLGDTVYRVGVVERQLAALRAQQGALAAEAESLQQAAAAQQAGGDSGNSQSPV